MGIEEILSKKTADAKYDIKDIREAGREMHTEYATDTKKLKTDITNDLSKLRENVEVKAIKEANERTRRMPSNQLLIKSLGEKINSITGKKEARADITTITTALKLISGSSDQNLQKVLGTEQDVMEKAIKNSKLIYFQRCDGDDRETLKSLCKVCLDGTFNDQTIKAICFLQAMSQDYFNADYGVDGVAGGNTLRALNSALEGMVPKETKKVDEKKVDEKKVDEKKVDEKKVDEKKVDEKKVEKKGEKKVEKKKSIDKTKKVEKPKQSPTKSPILIPDSPKYTPKTPDNPIDVNNPRLKNQPNTTPKQQNKAPDVKKVFEKPLPKEVFDGLFSQMDTQFQNLINFDPNLQELRDYLKKNDINLSLGKYNPNIGIRARDENTQKLETIKIVPKARFLKGDEMDVTGFRNSVFSWLNYTYLPTEKTKEAKREKDKKQIENYNNVKQLIRQTYLTQKDLFPEGAANIYLNNFFK